MLIAIATLFMAFVTLLAARYVLVKTRLTENSIDGAIARRMRTAPVMSEIRELRELNTVMRNLLVDLVENEESIGNGPAGGSTPAERKRQIVLRESRRREIYAEALFVLRQTERARYPVMLKKAAN